LNQFFKRSLRDTVGFVVDVDAILQLKEKFATLRRRSSRCRLSCGRCQIRKQFLQLWLPRLH